MALWCTYIFYNITVLKHTSIFTQRADDVLLTSMQRRNVTSTSVWHRHKVMCLLGTYSVSPDVGGGGLQKWPSSVCVCVCPPVIPYILLSVQSFPATPLTSFIGLIWNFIDCPLIIWRCAYGFWSLFRQFLTMLWPLLTHTLSPQLLPYLLSKWLETFASSWSEDVHVILNF